MEFFSIIINGWVAAIIYVLTSVTAFKVTKQANLDLSNSHTCSRWPIVDEPETFAILRSTRVACTPPLLHLKKSDDMKKPHHAKDLLTWAYMCREHDSCQ